MAISQIDIDLDGDVLALLQPAQPFALWKSASETPAEGVKDENEALVHEEGGENPELTREMEGKLNVPAQVTEDEEGVPAAQRAVEEQRGL